MQDKIKLNLTEFINDQKIQRNELQKYGYKHIIGKTTSVEAIVLYYEFGHYINYIIKNLEKLQEVYE